MHDGIGALAHDELGDEACFGLQTLITNEGDREVGWRLCSAEAAARYKDE
jgi:hypothetical protein